MEQKNLTARKLAYDLLLKVEKAGQYSNIALDVALQSCDLSDSDKRLTSALFYGVLERKITLDFRISQLSSRDISDIDVHTLCALRLGLYQLMFMDRIPVHAAIYETVELCNRRTSGFVNGILRAHTRNPEFSLPDMDDIAHHLSVKYSVCKALAQKIADEFGIHRAQSILSSMSYRPDLTLRTNQLRTDRDELLSHLPQATPTQLSPVGIHTKGAVRELYGYDEGLFFVQDEASQICTSALGARQGDLVMDICACPGSKSFGIAMDMKNIGTIMCYDLHENKLSLIHDGARRLGIDIIHTQQQDGRQLLPDMVGLADRVLCDVPCSGYGVISKKPELRYKDPSLWEALPQIQLDILNNACNYVKSGGTLVYSTCTIFEQENLNNVKKFLSAHPDFTLTPFFVGDMQINDGYISLMPDQFGTDGFFIAKMTRS